jgi:type I restriction enzyme M protein
MLNADTKRHIEAARDVLVGVAPNPMTQIDQITYALIYKFMDDMDEAAIKAGGDRSFFTGDLAPYAWSNLVDTRIGSQEKMDLFAEALTKFAEAPQLPELFRTIFRAAFLPYRSPETLGLFIKEINYFDYSHPEELGNAYEYLLSIMSAQGDAGQFRTPRHIIDFMVDVLDPTKDDTILDPACGTGGFLVSSYNHILEKHDGKNDPNGTEKPLTPAERKKLTQNLAGYDIDPSMVRIAQVNMYLHQFKNPQIFQYDGLTSEERWNDKFDVILANPPFMSPKGGIKPHNKFGIQSNRSEALFVDYIVSHLKPKGRAGIVVPEGVIFKNDAAFKALRKNLIENGLYAVVSLPGGVFQPYSGVKTSILFIDKEISIHKSAIAFIKISADGFNLGTSKRVTEKNDLPEALKILKDFSLGADIDRPIATLVSKEDLENSGGYNLSVEKYIESTDYSDAKWPMAKLGDVATVDWGNTNLTKSLYVENGSYLAVSATGGDGRIDHFEHEVGTTVLSAIGANCGKVFFPTERFTAIKNTMTISPNREVVLPRYLHAVLQQISFPRRGGGQPFVAKGDAVELVLPVPPLDVQERLVAELGGYAAIISGAKQIVENWKPQIDVDLEWPSLKLGELCELITKGTTPTSVGFDFTDSGINFVKVESLNSTGQFIISKFAHISIECHESLKRSQLKTGDVLFSIAGALGRTAIVTSEILPANTNQALAILRLKSDSEVQPQFLEYVLGTQGTRSQSAQNQTGVAQQNLSLGQLGDYLLPIPSLEIQNQIIAEISMEKLHVDAAKKLIETYEAKTQAVIAKLWSE